MAISKEDILEYITGLSVLDLSELIEPNKVDTISNCTNSVGSIHCRSMNIPTIMGNNLKYNPHLGKTG